MVDANWQGKKPSFSMASSILILCLNINKHKHNELQIFNMVKQLKILINGWNNDKEN